jgi:O-antigen/teichoic acid export membrane protein
VVWLGLGVGAALAATAAHQAVGALLLCRRAAPAAARAAPLAPAARGRILRYAASVGALLVLDAVVWQQSEALFLRAFAPAVELGLYTVAYQLAAQSMTLVPGSFNAALFPALAAQVGAGDDAALARTVRRGIATLAGLALPIAALGAVAAGPILALLYGEPYRAGAPVLRLVLAAGAVGAVAGGASSLLYARERQGTLLRIGVAAAAVNLALDALLIPRGGAVGAAIANGLAQATAAAATAAAAGLVLARPAARARRGEA